MVGLSFDELQQEIEARMARLDEAQEEQEFLGAYGDLLRTAAMIAFQRAAELIDANNRDDVFGIFPGCNGGNSCFGFFLDGTGPLIAIVCEKAPRPRSLIARSIARSGRNTKNQKTPATASAAGTRPVIVHSSPCCVALASRSTCVRR